MNGRRYLKSLRRGDSKAAEAEEKEYLWAAEGDDGIIELLLDSKETTADGEGGKATFGE